VTGCPAGPKTPPRLRERVWCLRGDCVPREKHREAFPWKQEEFSRVQEEYVGHCAVDLRSVVTSSQNLGLKLRFEMHIPYKKEVYSSVPLVYFF